MKKILIAFLFVATTASASEVTFERDTTVPLVYINVAVKAGSVNDPKGQSGITNFMGEMLMRGTTSKTKEQIDLILDQMGAKLEVEVRAEALIFRGAVLADKLDPFLSLLNEILTHPSFPENEIRKLKAEMISGILEELGHDQSLAYRRFQRFLFGTHPYGNPILGTVADIQKLNRAKLMNQYQTLIHEKNLLVIGSGDAEASKIRNWSDKLSEERPSGDKSAVTEVTAPENAPERRMEIVDKADRTQTQIYFGQVGIKMTDPDFFALHLGNHAFGGPSFSARLMVEIRVKKGWSYGARSNFRFGREPRLWQVYYFPAAKDTAAALAEGLKMVGNLQKSGITQEEFAFAQQSLVNSAGFMYNTPRKRVENVLLEKTLNLPDGFMKSYGPELSKVTLAQVNESLAKFMRPENLAITVLATAQDLKSDLAKAASIPIDKVKIVPYTQEQ